MHPWFNRKTHPTITELMSWQMVFSGASKTCAAVYIGLLFCWAVVSGAHKQTSWSSSSCLLMYSLVLLRSVGRFSLLLCQLHEKLLFKVDRPHTPRPVPTPPPPTSVPDLIIFVYNVLCSMDLSLISQLYLSF